MIPNANEIREITTEYKYGKLEENTNKFLELIDEAIVKSSESGFNEININMILLNNIDIKRVEYKLSQLGYEVDIKLGSIDTHITLKDGLMGTAIRCIIKVKW